MLKALDFSAIFLHRVVALYTDSDVKKKQREDIRNTREPGGVEGDTKKLRFSTNISLYLWNDTKYSHITVEDK